MPPVGAGAPGLDAMLRLILTSRVYDVCRETPLEPAPRLSRRLATRCCSSARTCSRSSASSSAAPTTGSRTWPRGRARGVIAASAGNHAQGVAFSARRLGHPRRDRHAADDAGDQGGGGTGAGRRGRAGRRQLRRREGAVRRARSATTGLRFIPPVRRPAGDCGPGHDRRRDPAAEPARSSTPSSSPVGGGGLITGIGSYIKALHAGRADHRRRAVRGRRDVPVAGRRPARGARRVGIFADGVAVREVGEHTFAARAATVDEIVRVINDEICAAIKDVFDDTRSDHRAGRRAGGRRAEGVGRARRRPRASARRRAQRREHELRSAALRRRARRARRGARGASSR